MPDLGVSEFSLIAVSTAKVKLTKIRTIANRESYHPAKDYYKQLRDGIKRLFIKKGHVSELYDLARRQKDSSKKINFEKVINQFKEWQTGKNINAFTPPRNKYHYGRTDIICNPELNVNVAGESKLVKLHFSSSDKMTQERANHICLLMQEAINDPGFIYSVLDLTSGKEYFFNSNPEKQLARIQQEILFIEQNWP